MAIMHSTCFSESVAVQEPLALASTFMGHALMLNVTGMVNVATWLRPRYRSPELLRRAGAENGVSPQQVIPPYLMTSKAGESEITLALIGWSGTRTKLGCHSCRWSSGAALSEYAVILTERRWPVSGRRRRALERTDRKR